MNCVRLRQIREETKSLERNIMPPASTVRMVLLSNVEAVEGNGDGVVSSVLGEAAPGLLAW